MSAEKEKRDDTLNIPYMLARVVSSNYGPPLVVVAVVLAFRWTNALWDAACEVVGWNPDSLLWCWRLLQVVSLVLAFALPVWLVCRSFYCAMERKWMNIFHSWLACGVAFVLLMGGILLCSLAEACKPNLFTWNTSLMEGREYVLPRGLCKLGEAERNPHLIHLFALREKARPATAEHVVPEAPNLSKLTEVASPLLHEYVYRCLYAEATNPRFSSAILAQGNSVCLAHGLCPQTLVMRARYYDSSAPLSTLVEANSGSRWAALLRIPLQNGWYFAADFHKDAFEMPTLAALDEELAPLAQNPTPEQLDAMLPPVPNKPFLCLWESYPGWYGAAIIVPEDYPRGTFRLRAYEVSQGKHVCLTRVEWSHGNIAAGRRILSSRSDFCVDSGDEGAYFAATWEILFTPEGGGEERCVNAQEFLIQGCHLK